MQKMIYHIQNMKCSGCASQIKERLSKIHGISSINANIKEDSISFTYDTIETLDQVRAVLAKMGYPLSDVENTMSNITKSYLNCMIGKVRNAI